jgi:hypothetical protein
MVPDLVGRWSSAPFADEVLAWVDDVLGRWAIDARRGISSVGSDRRPGSSPVVRCASHHRSRSGDVERGLRGFGADMATQAGGPFRLFDLGDAFWSHPFAVLHLPLRAASGVGLADPLPPGAEEGALASA